MWNIVIMLSVYGVVVMLGFLIDLLDSSYNKVGLTMVVACEPVWSTIESLSPIAFPTALDTPSKTCLPVSCTESKFIVCCCVCQFTI